MERNLQKCQAKLIAATRENQWMEVIEQVENGTDYQKLQRVQFMYCFPCLTLSKCAIHLVEHLQKLLKRGTGKRETMKDFLNFSTARGKPFAIATAAEITTLF